MTRRTPDLHVGGWLGVGFGAAGLLLVLATALAIALLARISAAERRQVQFIAPRAAAASRLETELMRVGITSRAYALAEDARTLDAYRDAQARFRDARVAFEALPKEPDGAVHLTARIELPAPTANLLVAVANGMNEPDRVNEEVP